MNPISTREVRTALIAGAIFIAIALLIGPVRSFSVDSKDGKAVAVHAAGRGNPHINLTDGLDLHADFTGVSSKTMQSGDAKPVAIAAGDFNGDDVIDLVGGYSGPEGGLIVMHLGAAVAGAHNESALEASSKTRALPFQSSASVFAIPTAPDFLGVGDFNRDGFLDVICATKGGGELYLLAGDGAGRLGPPIAIGLPGIVTAMAIGDLNHRDGLADVAVAISASAGARVLVFDAPEAPFIAEPTQYEVPSEVASLAVGRLDGDAYADLAVASGGTVVLIHGGLGRRDIAKAVERVDLPFRVWAVTSGDFVGDGDHRAQIAALGDDGRVHLLARGGMSSSTVEHAQMVLNQAGWKEAGAIQVASRASVRAAVRRGASQSLLTTARLSDQPTDDLLVVIPDESRIHVIINNANAVASDSSSIALRLAATLDVEGSPLATLPILMPQFGQTGLAVLRKGQAAPAILLPAGSSFRTQAPASTFTNSAAITIPAAPSASPAAASPYPSVINVSSLTGSISAITVKLNSFHHAGQKDVDAVLIGPTGASLVFMSDMGGAGSAAIFDLTFDDSAAGIAPNTVISATATYKPTNYDNPVGVGDSFPGAPGSPYNNAAPTGSATLTSVFAGTNPNGNWSLYIFDDAGGDGGACDSGWTLNITTAVAASPTTTTVVSSLNPSMTTNAVTFTAHVVKTSDSSNVTVGTVSFSDTTLGTTLAANVALNGTGQAQYAAPANSLTERSHVITATYNPDPSFFGSSASVTQTVDFPTSNPSTGMYCNTNSMATPGPGGGTGVPYPSHISVSGLGGSISHLVVTLKNATHVNPGDLDILLVGPLGQNIILVSDAGENSTNTNVTVNLDDLAGSALGASMTPWGAPNSTVSSKPVNYGVGDTFPSPAPSVSNNPAPVGSATLGSVFNGANPNGTWSLYVFDDSGFDTNTFAGGWCLTFTTTGDAVSSTSLTSSVNPSFTTSPNDSTTFSATVTSGGNPVTVGTVSFVDASTGATICANVPLDGAGHASCITSFATEGDRIIMANYSGAPGQFNTSSSSLTQQINNHTTISGNQFCNPGVISIPDSSNVTGGGIARPYPSRIFVSGLSSICSLTVSLSNLSHADPDDIDILLVGPNGQNIILMSDVGGAADVSGLNLTFSDAASNSLPDGSPLVSGTFKPTNFEVIDSFPSPAPTPGSNTTLAAAFSGSDPNGVWSLYVVDDALGGTGQIADGWCLNFATVSCTIDGPDPVCEATANNTYTAPSGANLTYVWSITGNGSIVGSTTSQSVNVTAGLAGSYNLMLMVNDTSLSCSSTCSKTVTVNTCADVTITKSGPATASCGDTISYTLTASNLGPGAAANVVVTDDLPACLTVISCNSDMGGVCGGAGANRTVTFPSLASGISATITIMATANPGCAPSVSNTASISTTTTDSNPGNNTSNTVMTTVTCADVGVTKSAGSGSICSTANITYTINFTNAGPSAATGVVVSDVMPAGTSLVSAPAPANWTRTDGVVAGGNGALMFARTGSSPNADAATFTVIVSIDGAVSDGTILSNTASVTSTTPDQNSANNTSSPATMVTVKKPPTPATVGAPQTICALGTTATLGGNAPAIGTGTWTVQSGGTGTFIPSAGSAAATFTHTSGTGPIVLRWTISNPPCVDSFAEVSITITPTPPTPTITPGGPTTFCAGGSVTLTSSSASGNQWFLNGDPIGGSTSQAYVATASGDYTVQVTTSGCSGGVSAPTTVTVNPIPATPTVTPGGPTTFCTGGSVTLTSSNATGNQWYLNGNPIGGATNQTYVATASGAYTVTVTTTGCISAPSAPTVVTVNPIPATPTITPGGPTTFCAGGSVTLTSSGAVGNQWFLNGNPIGGAVNQTYVATASGDYSVTVTLSGCTGDPSAPVAVTVNPIPATPTITPGGPTTFCAGGSVTLTSSSASGNQWYLNSNPIGGATNQTYIATASGAYTVTVTTTGCTSAPSAPTVVTVNPIPATPTITPGSGTTFCAGDSVTLTSSSATGNQWLLNGNPIGGATAQQYVATASGDYTVTVTTNGCTGAPSAVTTVTVKQPPTTATAGGPQTICEGSATATLGGNSPSSGTGLWTIVTGGATGTFSPSANSPGATFTPTSGAGVIVVRWTISNPPCPDSFADVTITVKQQPIATAGGPQTICAGGTSSSLGGNTPTGGAIGTWSIVTAGAKGTFNPNANTPGATFTHSGGSGPITVRWTVVNPPCSSASADVILMITQPPTTATAGSNQIIPPNGTTAPLGGNSPAIGTGLWTIVTGGASGVFNPTASTPNATFTHTGGSGQIVLRWTISNPPCPSSQADVTIQIGIPPAINCPSSPVVANTAPDQCSTTVTFSVTATGLPTPTVTCTPPSGSVFPKGGTMVNCTATNGIAPDANCSFTVMVNDMQPPSITCPANITTKTAQAGNSCVAVNYPAPAAADNCPGVSVVCTPPSGSCFPLGVNTVTCTATDVSGNTAMCTFRVNVFDLCVQDDSDPSTVVLINSVTGDYRFCCHGVTYTGKGTMTIRGSLYTLEHNPGDRRVLVKDDEATHKGSGSMSAPPGTVRCTLTDRNTRDNSCICQ